MYSQNSEEKVITTYFKGFTGRCLDIGAALTFSNTRKLIELGWSAVLYEPNDQRHAELANHYQYNDRVVIHKQAVADYDGTIQFYSTDDLVSTTLQQETIRWKNRFNKVKVPCVSVKSITDHHGHFDFVNIDAEGQDLNILRQFDLSKVKMVCVEFNGKDQFLYDSLMKDFHLIYKSGENLIYAR